MISLAVAGKGGCGKTTFSAALIRFLLQRNYLPLLAVDADPNANLNESLGVDYRLTIGEIVEEMKKLESGSMDKETWLSIKAEEALTESQGFDLLVMGRPEGPGCYCAANNLLRSYLDRLAKAYQALVIDNEAGMEHLNRRLTRDIDYLFLIAEPTSKGLATARRLYNLANSLELNIKRFYLVVNKVTSEEETQALIDFAQPEVLGFLPYDKQVLDNERENKSIFELSESSAYWQSLTKLLSLVFEKELVKK